MRWPIATLLFAVVCLIISGFLLWHAAIDRAEARREREEVEAVMKAAQKAVRDAEAIQNVLDDSGQPVYGTWVYIDEPEILEERID